TQEVEELVGSERLRLANIMVNVESITTNLKNNGGKLNSILDNLDNFTDSLAHADLKETIDNAQLTLSQVEEITRKINSGEGSLGLLLNDDQLYNNLNNTSARLNTLIEDLSENPGKYLKLSIFGKRDTK